MRIASIESGLYWVPLRSTMADQTHRLTHIELLTISITSGDGLVGVGFGSTAGTGASAIEALIQHHVAPSLLGTLIEPEHSWRRMWWATHDAGGGGLTTMAIGAIDIALWDLVAKERDIPLVELIGRRRESIPAYASGINLDFDLARLEEQVRGWIDDGYTAVKIKVGKPDLKEDVERVAMVRAVIGDRTLLMLDANQGWDAPTAIAAIQAMKRFDPYWIEEPMVADDVEGHAQIKDRSGVPIAIGENVYTEHQFADFLGRKACDFIQPNVVRVGGITPWLAIAERAALHGTPVAPHSNPELSGQLLCCIPNAAFLEDTADCTFDDLGVLVHDLGVSGGRFTPRPLPGHGIEFDLSILDRYAVPASSDAMGMRGAN